MTEFEVKGEAFTQWLIEHGATVSDSIALGDFRDIGAGRGVLATQDIKEDEVLFSIPRRVVFSTLTAKLRTLPGMTEAVDRMTGWNPLIICMMYESQRDDSFWKPYFEILPKEFSTPMFWGSNDLEALQGTDIPDKIGKEDAERLFAQEIAPLIQDHPDLFDSQIHTMELFHRCGSLIMAYSFHDELGSDSSKGQSNEKESPEDEEYDDDEEEDDAKEDLIMMVPMADMLNHKTGHNNARLFYEPDRLQMKAIKPIKKGEQLYNTYGDLCNADLLRKYGFTDENNIFDLCELDGLLVCEVGYRETDDASVRDSKVDFLMEEGVWDDCFVIDGDHEIPPELIVTVHVLRASTSEFEAMRAKSKLPKPRLTEDVKQVLIQIIERRASRYGTPMASVHACCQWLMWGTLGGSSAAINTS